MFFPILDFKSEGKHKTKLISGSYLHQELMNIFRLCLEHKFVVTTLSNLKAVFDFCDNLEFGTSCTN